MDEKKARLIEIVGEAGVLDNPELGEPVSLDHNLIPPMRPRFMVKPRNVDEVQNVVLWANQTQTPLVPLSSGGPHFRGDVGVFRRCVRYHVQISLRAAIRVRRCP